MNQYNPTNPSLFFSKDDQQDVRIGELAHRWDQWLDLNEFKTQLQSTEEKAEFKSYYLGGYPDDDGIKLNGGRIGARKAPDAIRKFLYRMTPPLDESKRKFKLNDIGNLSTQLDLSERHESGRRYVQTILEEGCNFIGLGGGHDYAYPDGAGFLKACLNQETQDQKPLILNIDAHLDVRPLDKGLSSGTPFYRLLSEFEGQFDFVEIGIQDHCNSSFHLNWAIEKGAQIIPFSDFDHTDASPFEFLKKKLSALMSPGRPTYLSIDIDGFSSSFAMGCSQSWATGFHPNDIFPLISWLKKQVDVRVLGIYEVSPPLDLDDRTSKLASQLIYQYLTT